MYSYKRRPAGASDAIPNLTAKGIAGKSAEQKPNIPKMAASIFIL